MPQNNLEWIYEEFLPGREFSVTAFLKNKKLVCLPPAEVKKAEEVFTQEEKYGLTSNFLEVPAKIDKKLNYRLKEICQKCYSLLGCFFYTKVDVILDKDGQPNVIEVDGIPGFGPKSVITQAAAAVGISFRQLVCYLLKEAGVKE